MPSIPGCGGLDHARAGVASPLAGAPGQHGELDMADGLVNGLAKEVEVKKLLNALPAVLRHRLTEDLGQQAAAFRQGQ